MGVVDNNDGVLDPIVDNGTQEEGDVDSNVDGIAAVVDKGSEVALFLTKPGGKAGLA